MYFGTTAFDACRSVLRLTSLTLSFVFPSNLYLWLSLSLPQALHSYSAPRRQVLKYGLCLKCSVGLFLVSFIHLLKLRLKMFKSQPGARDPSLKFTPIYCSKSNAPKHQQHPDCPFLFKSSIPLDLSVYLWPPFLCCISLLVFLSLTLYCQSPRLHISRVPTESLTNTCKKNNTL